MLTSDTQTIVYNASGTQTIVLIPQNTTNTILGVAISQENLASDTNLVCRNPATGDQKIILTNFAKTISYAEMNFVCPNGYDVEIQKTGNDQSQTILNYVPYDRTQLKGFTQGEVINGVFLFFIFMALSYLLFRVMYKPIKIKN
jgi:hypothetical protein